MSNNFIHLTYLEAYERRKKTECYKGIIQLLENTLDQGSAGWPEQRFTWPSVCVNAPRVIDLHGDWEGLSVVYDNSNTFKVSKSANTYK